MLLAAIVHYILQAFIRGKKKIKEEKTVNCVFLDHEHLGEVKLERKQLSETVNEVKVNCCWRVLT